LAALLGVVGWVGSRGEPAVLAPTPASSDSSQAVAASPAVVAAASSAIVESVVMAAPQASAVPASQSSVPPSRSISPKPLAPPSAPASAVDVAASAVLRLTADPRASVTVVGARVSQTHVTPISSLKLPPGSYSVTFRSPTFGAPVVAQVELSAGTSRSVHADFRAAEPTVTVR
jgi:hypothetical protein